MEGDDKILVLGELRVWEVDRTHLAQHKAERASACTGCHTTGAAPTSGDLGHLQPQNAVLSALAERHTDLIARARVQIEGITREREALRAEYDRVLQS